jgi:hypothetical protein
MRSACRLVAALAATAGAVLLVAAPVSPLTPAAGASATTVAPASPTATTSLQLPTQNTSLSPVTAPPTTAASINDSRATQLVNRVIFILVVLAVAVALLTIWYWRSTRPVPPALDGLDLMSTRRWLKGRSDKRSRMLTEYHTRRGPVPDETIARTAPAGVRVGAAVAAPEAVPVLAGVRAESVANGANPAAGQPLLVVAQGPAAGESGTLAELVQAREAGSVAPEVNGRAVEAPAAAQVVAAAAEPSASAASREPVAESPAAPEAAAPDAAAVDAMAVGPLAPVSPPAGLPIVDEAMTEPAGGSSEPDRPSDAPFTVVARRPRGVASSEDQPSS